MEVIDIPYWKKRSVILERFKPGDYKRRCPKCGKFYHRTKFVRGVCKTCANSLDLYVKTLKNQKNNMSCDFQIKPNKKCNRKTYKKVTWLEIELCEKDYKRYLELKKRIL